MTNKRRANQRTKVLRYLRSHKRGLSNRDMVVRMNIGSPTKVISELREEGHNIIGTRIDIKGDDGESTYYFRYTLKEGKR